MVDNIKANGFEVSYFQRFEISLEDGQQRIIHSQERPDYKNKVVIGFTGKSVKAIIYVIDDGSYSTMILLTEH